MKNLTLLLFIALTLHATAQNKKEDILYLKNGGVIYGIIKEKTDKIKIQISGGSIMVYRMDEIDSMKQEPLTRTLRRDYFANYYRKDKGYRNITEVQFTYGPQPSSYSFEQGYESSDDVGLSIHTINGYQVCPQFFVGAGVGLDRLLTFRQTFLPLYVRLQTEILRKRITPYFFGDIGYAFFVQDQNGYDGIHHIGGLYMTLGAGVHFYTKGPLSCMIGLGYRRNYGEEEGANIYQDYKVTYQRLVATWGLTF